MRVEIERRKKMGEGEGREERVCTGFEQLLNDHAGALGRLDCGHLLAQVQSVRRHESLLLARIDHHKLALALHLRYLLLFSLHSEALALASTGLISVQISDTKYIKFLSKLRCGA
jgi:hypothetical protein